MPMRCAVLGRPVRQILEVHVQRPVLERRRERLVELDVARAFGPFLRRIRRAEVRLARRRGLQQVLEPVEREEIRVEVVPE
jgi:hypothetical protein